MKFGAADNMETFLKSASKNVVKTFTRYIDKTRYI